MIKTRKRTSRSFVKTVAKFSAAVAELSPDTFKSNRMFWLYLSLVGICAAYLTHVIYHNRFGQETEQVLFKSILIPLAAAVALVFTEQQKPLISGSKKVPVVVVRSIDYRVAEFGHMLALTLPRPKFAGYYHLESYAFIYHDQTGKLKLSDAKLAKEQSNLITDLLELSLIQILKDNFPNHWQVERDFIYGVSGGGGNIKQKQNAFPESVHIDHKQVVQILKGNAAIERVSLAQGLHFCIPKGGKFLKTIDSYGRRVLTIDTPELELHIQIAIAGGDRPSAGPLAELLQSTFPQRSSWANHFWITVEWREKRRSRWSPSTEEQRKWADEISSIIEQAFSWDLLNEELLKKKR